MFQWRLVSLTSAFVSAVNKRVSCLRQLFLLQLSLLFHYSVLFFFAYTHTRVTALFPGLPRWAGTRKLKPIWTLLKQETVSGNGISWATCKSASRFWHITTPASHHSVFYRSDALPAAQPAVSKHWRNCFAYYCYNLLQIHCTHYVPETQSPKWEVSAEFIIEDISEVTLTLLSLLVRWTQSFFPRNWWLVLATSTADSSKALVWCLCVFF